MSRYLHCIEFRCTLQKFATHFDTQYREKVAGGKAGFLMSNYAQISETLIDHPKTTRAIRILRMNRMQFVGHLACLWNWAIKNAPDGELSRFTARDIADAARFTDPDDFEEKADEDAERFLRALIDCRTSGDGHGLIEEQGNQLLIHDWQEFGGKLHKKREAGAERMRNARAGENPPNLSSEKPCAAHVRRTDSARSDLCSAPLRSGAKRSVTEQSEENPNDPPTPYEATGSLTDTAPPSARSDRPNFSIEIENILTEADADPKRAHWRKALDDQERREAAKITHRNPWRRTVLLAWVHDPSSAPLAPPPPEPPPPPEYRPWEGMNLKQIKIKPREFQEATT